MSIPSITQLNILAMKVAFGKEEESMPIEIKYRAILPIPPPKNTIKKLTDKLLIMQY